VNKQRVSKVMCLTKNADIFHRIILLKCTIHTENSKSTMEARAYT